MVKITPEQFNADILASMDIDYNELRRILDPVFHNKTKYIETKLMRECFRHIKAIIQSHHHLRRNAYD